MKMLRSFLFLTFFLISLTGCGNILYVSRLGWHQAFITFRSIPVQEVLEDEGVNVEAKKKIRFIQEVKRYGEKRFGLKKTKSYSTFFEVKEPILYVVAACEKDRLQSYHWNFPITGRVEYKGFFTREGVLKEKRFLEEKGYDTFMQCVSAYSTLGWLRDPIFSSMLEWNDAILANLILHEMTHATVYFKGETRFNEQAATFVGNRGAIDFLTEKYGPGSKERVEAIHIQEDDLLFSRWIDQVCQQLSNFYAQKIPRDEKLRGREEIFRSIKEEFRKMKIRFKTDCYNDFEKIDLNNAVLLAYRRYIHNLEKFETLYEHMGRDLKRVIEFLKKIQKSGKEPSSFLEQWMKERGITVPSSLR
jgi:predicted aminopeptidase